MPRDFQLQAMVFGVTGLDIQTTLNELEPTAARRLTNLVRLEGGGLTVRPGLTVLATSAELTPQETHTIVRLNDPDGAVEFGFTDDLLRPRGYRFVGGGTSLCIVGGNGGSAITQIDTGWSGDGLYTLAYRPSLSAAPWLYIADTAKMRKVRAQSPTTALVLPLGLPRPTNPDSLMEFEELPLLIKYRGGTSFAIDDGSTVGGRDTVRLACGAEFDTFIPSTSYLFTLDDQRRTVIDYCESAVGWTGNAGTGGGAPTVVTDTDAKQGTFSIKVTTVAPATLGYYSFINKALVVDLSKLALSYRATDLDQIHAWVKLDRPDVVDEVRVYFILSNYSGTAVPGATAGSNDNAFVLVFRPSDFQAFVEVTASQASAAGTSNAAAQTAQQAAGGANQAAELPLGRAIWTELGIVDRPVLRGDPADAPSRAFAGFKRIGEDSALGWDDVIGISIVIKTLTNTAVNLWVDDFYLYGGAGLDSSYPGNQKYNYRYTHYDPRTGAESNPCNITPQDLWADSIRTGFILKPETYGDTAIRQKFYRQGGALVRNWYLAGMNGSDGGLYTDTRSDNSLFNADLLQTDHDQPVTTVDVIGRQVYAQPLPVIFGPINDVIFGLGDPYRRGNIYWCKPGQPDHWPPTNTRELCGSSEELIAGCVWNNQPYAFSRLRRFLLYPNLLASGTVDYLPLGAGHGPINRFCVAPTDYGIAIATPDGIYMTDGPSEQSLTDEKLRPLFRGKTVAGYAPIDPLSLDRFARLVYHQGELWFLYGDADPDGARDSPAHVYALIYNFLQKYWRFYQFADTAQLLVVYSEPTQPSTLLVGARETCTLWRHTGATDASPTVSAAIDWVYRSGALDQNNARRLKEYGDVWVDLDRQGNTVSLTLYADNETLSLAAINITTGAVRQDYALDPFTGGSVFQGDAGSFTARNVSIQLAGSTSSATPPIIYQGGPSFLLQPETTVGRVLCEQDDQGRLTDKFVKGLMLECDTDGNTKSLSIQAEGVQQTTITATAAGRRSLLFSWTQFRGRLLRVVPLDSTPWVLWGFRWIFDEEPAQLARWETQLQDYGIPGWKQIPYCWLTLESTAATTLTLTGYGANGTPVTTITKTIASTGGAKRTLFQGLNAGKAILWKWVFVGDASATDPATPAFFLYKGESKALVQAWSGGDPQWVQPFGDDDLDGTRGLRDAGLGASRGGGGEGA